MGSINYAQAIKPDTARIRKLIDNSLLGDWIIRIEFENTHNEFESWQEWDKPLFAIRSADAVLDTLMECYKQNQHCTIRINAEKIRPQSRMLYTVYNPQYLPIDFKFKNQTATTLHPRNKDHLTPHAGIMAQG